MPPASPAVRSVLARFPAGFRASRAALRACLAGALVACLALAVVPAPVSAQSKNAEEADRATRPRRALDPDLILQAIVRVRVQALPDARSNSTLGREREGTGILIDGDGTVLTIGYVIVESDAIEVTLSDGKTLPARPAAYDHATGLGLVKVQGALAARPLPLGESAAVAVRDPVLIVPFGGTDSATVARVMSRRVFTGSWEYMLESAIFTAPPTMQWAGAALVDRQGRLVGVGSLLVRDTVEPGKPQPGNMFVPIDVLKPILPELVARGKRAGPARPWLGLATDEIEGRLVVSRVSPGSPADRAGLRRGDVVIGVGDAAVRTHVELYTRMWALGPAGTDVPLRVMNGADVREVKVPSIDRVEYFREKPAT